jgi:glycosyltransferase involved in cell wall biosynthesis
MLGNTVIRGKSRWVKTLWIRMIEQRTLREAAGLHVTAEVERDEIAALGLELPPIVCVPNGVSWPSAFAPLSAGPFAHIPRPYALFLSRIDWKKGLDRLIRAWQWVPHLSLVIAGNDETGYTHKLKKIATEARVSNRVHFIGHASDEHKWALYAEASLFVLPSYSENFGNVVAEAMAMGRPVIVTPEVGLASLVEEARAGIVTDGAPAKLAEAIRSLYADAAGRELMGERGSFVARPRMSWDSVAGRLEASYADAADRSEARRRSVA